MPLPPYVRQLDNKTARQQDINNYQTAYADEGKVGSVAAPTAGFHFTKSLLNKLKKKGVQIEYVTLHVGLGTFTPVKVDDITKHKMHGEWVEADKATIARIYLAKYQNRRIITVGTTSTRSLEAIAAEFPISNFQFPNNFQFSMTKFTKQFNDFMENVNIFIYPGYEFKLVEAMITNFHLPKSTLLMLVSAMAGKKNIDLAYQEAIREKYRFYSYGDAMLIK
jgi:S-adenosylmethionine:tRNA ribosyltransferase-isomerase